MAAGIESNDEDVAGSSVRGTRAVGEDEFDLRKPETDASITFANWFSPRTLVSTKRLTI